MKKILGFLLLIPLTAIAAEQADTKAMTEEEAVEQKTEQVEEKMEPKEHAGKQAEHAGAAMEHGGKPMKTKTSEQAGKTVE